MFIRTPRGNLTLQTILTRTKLLMKLLVKVSIVLLTVKELTKLIDFIKKLYSSK